MKVLFINNYIHPKNLHAFMKYGFDIETIHGNINLGSIDLSLYDVVYSPSTPIQTNKYPNTKFIFGPHFSVFPEKHQLDMISSINTVYSQPSEWVCQFWQKIPECTVSLKIIPFGVDTEMFHPEKPLNMREKVFIYVKHRHPNELEKIIHFIQTKGFSPKIFDYVHKYNESDYIQYLKESKFAVWLAAHESQGFALQEALSSDVPLFVWNVTSLNQEYGCGYPDIPATTIPYWDNRCGEYFTKEHEMETTFDVFISKLNTYRPREFVLENLSIEKCAQKFVDVVNEIVLPK